MKQIKIKSKEISWIRDFAGGGIRELIEGHGGNDYGVLAGRGDVHGGGRSENVIQLPNCGLGCGIGEWGGSHFGTGGKPEHLWNNENKP